MRPIDLLAGCLQPLEAFLQILPLLDHEGRDVFNAEKLILAESTQRLSTQSELNSTSFKTTSVRVMVRVPLKADVGLHDGVLPLFVTGMVAGREC